MQWMVFSVYWAIPEKKTNRDGGGLRIYFSETLPPRNFTLRNSAENKLLPLEILQNCVTPLGNSKVKNQDPWELQMSFS